jgi:hypothetical protein
MYRKKTCGKKKHRRSGRSTLLKRNGSDKRTRLHKLAFGSAIRGPIREELIKAGGKKIVQKSVMKASKIAIAAARKSLKAAGGKRKIRTPRIIPIPKTGGILPLIPIFAGLSALGSLAGGAAGIVRAIKDVKKKRSDEKTGGALQLSTRGNGLFLKPYRSGLGLFMYNKSKN